MLQASLLDSAYLQISLAGLALLIIFVWFFTSKRGPKVRVVVAAVLSTILVALILNKTALKMQPVTAATPGVTIDEVGGTIFIVRVLPARDDNGAEVPSTKATVDQSAEVVEKRLKQFGFENVQVQGEGNNRLRVALLGVSPEEAQPARKTLEQLGKLQFKTVHPQSRVLADRVAADPDNEIVPGYELKELRDTDDEGRATTENILIARRASLDSSYVVHAQELDGPSDGKLAVKLSPEGGEKMFQLTKEMNHGRDRLAIVLDGVVLSAPVVQSSLGKSFEISGMADANEAKSLAAVLLNPLKHPLLVEEQRSVSSKLIEAANE